MQCSSLQVFTNSGGDSSSSSSDLGLPPAPLQRVSHASLPVSVRHVLFAPSSASPVRSAFQHQRPAVTSAICSSSRPSATQISFLKSSMKSSYGLDSAGRLELIWNRWQALQQLLPPVADKERDNFIQVGVCGHTCYSETPAATAAKLSRLGGVKRCAHMCADLQPGMLPFTPQTRVLRASCCGTSCLPTSQR